MGIHLSVVRSVFSRRRRSRRCQLSEDRCARCSESMYQIYVAGATRVDAQGGRHHQLLPSAGAAQRAKSRRASQNRARPFIASVLLDQSEFAKGIEPLASENQGLQQQITP